MPVTPSTVERLDAYLVTLAYDQLNRLVREVERARLRDSVDATGTLIIERARLLARKRNLQFDRVPTPMRLFMAPLTPFLVDRAMERRSPGRIARSSLAPIWAWLGRDLLPDSLADREAMIVNAILAGEMSVAATHVARLQAAAMAAVETALDAVDGDPRAYVRLAAHVGGERVLNDACEMVLVLKHADRLHAFGCRLPKSIIDLGEEEFDWLRGNIAEVAGGSDALTALALAVVMQRLRQPAQILRLAAYAAGSDLAARVALHPYGQAGELVLHDVAMAAAQARHALDDPADYPELQIALSRYYKLAHEMRVILEFKAADAWSARLTRIRAELSAAIEARIAAVPRLIRAIIAPRAALASATDDGGGAVRFSRPDPRDIAEAETGINLIHDARVCMSQLALNDVVARLGEQTAQFLTHACDALLARLREAAPDERPDARLLLDAAVRLTRACQGDEVAALLEHAGNRALHPAASARRSPGAWGRSGPRSGPPLAQMG